jgi:TBC1 domain family protein 5
MDLLQGAAKGVFERGERLGINQVVRDAVEEVKKNMQGLSPGPGSPRRASRNNAVSVDDVVATTEKSLADLEVRNKTLALLLSGTIEEIQKASDSTEDSSTKSAAVNKAIEKLRFIMLRLEDSNLPLQPDTPRTAPDTEATGTKPEQRPQVEASDATIPPNPEKSIEIANSQVEPLSPTAGPSPRLGRSIPRRPRTSVTKPSEAPKAESSDPGQPATGVPTRSTLAQSSFAWMLGPDEHSGPSDQSTSTKSSAPFLSSGRKAGSSAARERSAFLFGDDADEDDVNSQASPKLGGNKGDFGLEAMKRTDT